jgi:hypothetical protein
MKPTLNFEMNRLNLVQSDRILCVDPGPVSSGCVDFDGVKVTPVSAEYENNELLALIQRIGPGGNGYIKHMAIENIVHYGPEMHAGESTFETMYWVGRFCEAVGDGNFTRVSPRDVRLFFTGRTAAPKTATRRGIIAAFPATGGGKTPEIGTKSQPGALYGVTGHMLRALAVGVVMKYRTI